MTILAVEYAGIPAVLQSDPPLGGVRIIIAQVQPNGQRFPVLADQPGSGCFSRATSLHDEVSC